MAMMIAAENTTLLENGQKVLERSARI